MARMTRMARMARMARSLARMARWLADLADPITDEFMNEVQSQHYFKEVPEIFAI